MTTLNPVALVFVGFCTVIGYLLGSWAVGLAVGLGVVLLAEWHPDPYGPYDALMRRRRRR